jgi:hypothetical protein
MRIMTSTLCVALIAGLAGFRPACAAECFAGSLDAGKIAGLYQVGGQRLGRLFNLSQTLKGDDARFAVEAQGPLASFADASYLIADLLKLRSTMNSEADRDLVDADIKANLDLAGPAFYSASDYLGAMAPKVQNADLKSAITLGQQFVKEGIAVYGSCVKAPAH